MTRKIIYLINPISGTGGKSSLQDLITRRTNAENIDYRIIPTNAEGNYAFLIQVIEQEKITDIVICGGDGTVNAVAAALRGTAIRVGIIPMGSGNGLAFAAGLPKDPSKALDLIFAGKASWVDGFLINNEFSCMLCGIGFDAEVAHAFAKQKKRGLQTYMRMILTHFFSGKFYSFGFDTEGKSKTSFQTEAFFISIANANQFGNHFTIAPQASLEDGLLDIVIVKKMNKLRLLLAVIAQVRGKNPLQPTAGDIKGRKVLYFQTPGLKVTNAEQAPLHIDGEPKATASEFTIRITPRVFQLIRPHS